MPDDYVRRRLKEMRHRADTLFRALDCDTDGRLSPDEIDGAPEVLRGMADAGGLVRESALGRQTLISCMIRRCGIVGLLDADGDGIVTADDNLSDLSQNAENRMPMHTPAHMVA